MFWVSAAQEAATSVRAINDSKLLYTIVHSFKQVRVFESSLELSSR